MTQKQNPPRPVAGEFVIPTREEFLRTLDLASPALASVKAALDGGDVDGAGREFIKHFRTRDISSPLLQAWSVWNRDSGRAVHEIADDCLRGRLNDGYNVYDVPPDGIDWVDCPLFCLPRFPYFTHLVSAYHHTGDVRYARFIVDHSLEYMTAYPIEWFVGKHGCELNRGHYLVGPPTWWCLCPNRLEQWAKAVDVLRLCEEVTDEELLTILHRMLQETRYQMTQMPFWVERKHNVAGFAIRVIAILGCVMQDFVESEEWLRRDAQWLAEYLDGGFYPDGLYKELTLGYSSSVVAQTARSVHALRDAPAAASLKEMMIQALAAMVGIVKPTGCIPSFGDSIGRPIAVILHEPLIRWLNEPWLTALVNVDTRCPENNPDRYLGGSRTPEEDESVAWAVDGTSGGPEPPFRLWPQPGADAWGGYYAMRNNWSRNANYMMIDGGPWGTSHQHMDKLSFVITSQGVDFITDPCNTMYANNEPDVRLSTLHAGFMHNTITIDGVDEFVHGADEMATDEPLNNRWECGENWVLFEGEYDFSPMKPVLWKRRILFVDGAYWILQDVLIGTGIRLTETLLQGEASCSSRSVLGDLERSGSGTAEGQMVDIEQNFQFEEDITIELSGNDAVAVSPGGERLLLKQMGGGLVPEIVIGEEGSRKTYSTQYSVYGGEPKEFGHGRGWISRVINKILPAPAIVYGRSVSLPTAITLAIVPETEDQIDIAAVRAADEGGATVWTLPTRNGNLELLTSTERFEVCPRRRVLPQSCCQSSSKIPRLRSE